MANVIRIKRRLASSNSGTSLPALRNAELAFNEINNTLYIGRGGTNTEVNGDGVVATPIVGEGAVWTGTATFGNVKTTGYFAAGEEAYAYANSVLPTSDNAIGGKLLSTIQYVDEAVSRGVGSGMSLHPVAADVATTAPIAVGSYTEKLIGFPSVRIAFAPASQAEGLALYVLQGTPTIQGVNLVAGNRVLILSHLDNQALRGIWKIPTGATATTPWVREDNEMVAQYYSFGRRVYVTDGTNGNKTLAVNSNPLAVTNNVAGPGWDTLTWSVVGTGNLVPSGGNALFTRVVRARGSFYQIIRGKVVVDGIPLNQNDRFIFEPKNGEPGGIDPNYYPTYSTLSGFLGPDESAFDNARAGIYRVNYDRVTGGDVYNVVTRAGDLNDYLEFQNANNTNVYVTDGPTYKNTYCTISAATPFTLDTTVATFSAPTTPDFTTGALSGTPIIDGVQTFAEERNGSNIVTKVGSIILVKNEVDASTNGLYYIPVGGGTWLRHPTADTDGELAYGSYIRVKDGNVNKNSGFVLVTNLDPLDIDTDPLYFQSPQTTLDFRAGIGLARSDRTLYVKSADTGRIRVTEAGVDLAFIADVGGLSVETDPAQIGTAYLAVHADKYGRVLASSKDTLTADELRDKIVGVGEDDTTGTKHLVFSDSPVFTGTPTTSHPAVNDDSQQIATTGWVIDALEAGGGSQLLTADNTWTGANIFRKTSGTRFEQADGQAAVIVAGGAASSGNFTTTISPTIASPGTGSGAVAALTADRTITLPNASTTLVGFDTTQTLSNKTLTAPKMTGTHIADTNGNELIAFPAVVASAVNEITVTNAIANARPTISASGGDTNIDLALSGKGTGSVYVNGSIKLATANATSIADVNGNEIIKFPTTVASATNEITVTNAITGSAPEISATGSADANIDLKLTAKGSGVVTSTSNFTVSSGKALNLSNTTVNAGTDVQGQGALTNDINIVTSAPNAPSGVTLPVATAGRVVVVVNRSSQTNTVKIYPASGGTINALAANAAFSVAANSTAIFRASSTTQWYSELVDLVNGTTGTLAVGSGGTGATTFTNGALLKGAGTSAITTATSGTDYAPATPSGTAILKANNSGGFSSAASGTDYAPATPSGTAILKANNSGGFSSATAGTDYVVGGTTTVGKIVTQASVTTGAALQISSGVAPTSGSIGVGDFWNESGVLKFQPTGATSTTTKVLAFTDSNITGNAGGLTNTLVTGSGGTGAATFTSNGIIYGNGSDALQVTAAGTNNQVLQGNTSNAPTWVNSTGTGNVVRATSPQLTTSVTTDSTTFVLLNTTAATINAFGAATSLNIGVNAVAGQITNIASGVTTSGAKTVNIGTAGTGGTTAINIGSSAGSTTTTTLNGDVSVGGNLTVAGSTSVLNVSTLQVTDKNIELASVVAKTGLTATLTAGTNTVTLTSGTTAGLIPGQTLSKTSTGGGDFGAFPVVMAITNSTTFTVGAFTTSMVALNHATSGAITFNVLSTASAATAAGAGITVLDGSTGRNLSVSFFPVAMWVSSEHFGVASGKSYYIGTNAVLTGTTVGNANTSWSGSTIAVGSGGTGQTTFTSNGVLLGNGTNGLNVTAAGTANQVLRVPSAGGAPAFGAIDVSNSSAVTGTLAVGNGGTGATTFTNGALLKGAGTSAITTATSGTDYAPATPAGTAILKANNSGGFSSAASGTDYAPATPAGTAILKANNSGGFSSATSGTDYAPATPSGTAILKANNSGGFSSATAGTDYVVAGTATVGGLLLSTTTGITAAGTVQADAAALTNDINVVTTTPASAGVRLPLPAAGRVIAVVNRGANALKVYPATSTAINTLGNNAAFSVAASATLTLRGSSTTQWYAELTAESLCSLVADCTLDGGTF